MSIFSNKEEITNTVNIWEGFPGNMEPAPYETHPAYRYIWRPVQLHQEELADTLKHVKQFHNWIKVNTIIIKCDIIQRQFGDILNINLQLHVAANNSMSISNGDFYRYQNKLFMTIIPSDESLENRIPRMLKTFAQYFKLHWVEIMEDWPIYSSDIAKFCNHLEDCFENEKVKYEYQEGLD